MIDPPLFLNTSKTYDNTFFVYLSLDEDCRWVAYNDEGSNSDNEDEGYTYYYDGSSFSPSGCDFFLVTSLSPSNQVDYKLEVNDEPVNDNHTWSYSNFITDDPIILNVTANWLLKFDVTCNYYS